jgi:hypothetical protein
MLKKTKEFEEEKISERWSYLIEGAQGRGKEIFENTKKNLEKINPPRVQIKEEMLTPRLTLFGGSRAEKRKFLVASNEYLREYRLYVGAKDYGNQLMVSWYLISEPGSILKLVLEWIKSHWQISLGVFFVAFIPAFIIKAMFPILIVWLVFLGYVVFTCLTSQKSVLPQMMNIFDLEELTAYVTTIHHAVLDATKEVSESVGFDFTKVDQKSKGFLNIS